MPCSLPVRSRVVMIVTPVAKEPSALRSSRALKPSAAVLCTVALWLPGSSVDTCFPRFDTLERRIWRQAKRDAAVHGAVDVPIQHVMRIRGMHVAECALQRVPRINRAAAGCGEQQIDRLGAQHRRKGAVAAVAGALAEVRYAAFGDAVGCRVAIAEHDRP